MNTWVIGDIHGCYYTLKDLLTKLPNEDINIVFVGDLIDRGPHSRQVVTLVKSLVESKKAVCLLGNHEEMSFNDKATWMYNGGEECIESYGDDKYLLAQHIDWFKTLPLFHETEDAFIVHAGVDPEYDLDDQISGQLLWIRGKFHASDRNYGKLIIFGHTPLKEISIKSCGHIGIDTGCVFGNKLTAYCVETREILSSPLNKKDENTWMMKFK